MILRERGIYRLPNGRELVVLRNDEEGSVLYGPLCCKLVKKGEFLVNEAGRLVFQVSAQALRSRRLLRFPSQLT